MKKGGHRGGGRVRETIPNNLQHPNHYPGTFCLQIRGESRKSLSQKKKIEIRAKINPFRDPEPPWGLGCLFKVLKKEYERELGVWKEVESVQF